MDIKKIAKQLKGAGLSERASQLTMIEQAYHALSKQKIICMEAPTGTGKTISYSIAAYLAKTDKQTVVISTATIALQEQLWQKDLPLLGKILGVTVKAAMAKGRRRYVCHARLFDDDRQIDIFSRGDFQNDLRSLITQESWDGDRDQLSMALTDAEWSQVSTDSAGCSGKLCTYYQQCAFLKARQKWQQSDFVITNHSLLLSDLVLGGGVLLPEMEKTIYILDECHHFPDKALDHFAEAAPLLDSSHEWLNQFNNTINKTVQNGLFSESKQQSLQTCSSELIVVLQALQDFLRQNSHLFTEDGQRDLTWRCTEDNREIFALALPIYKISTELTAQCQQLLDALHEKLKLTANDAAQQQQLTKLIAQLGFFHHRMENLWATFQLFCQSRQPNEPPVARWFVKNHHHHYYCHAAPINISQRLKQLFWERITQGALLCSATVRATGDFSDFRRKAGLTSADLQEIVLDSCFDYSKSVLFVPTMRTAPQGGEQAAHWEEAKQLLPALILPQGGTLILFTSKAAMEKTYADMPEALRKDILMQGAQGKSLLLAAHKEKINAQCRSVLFGLASFGEGLDLPAEYCQHVIIHKLPFAVPTTPIELTRSEWLTQNQRNPFELATLPATAIRLAQYAGRLIRQETDIGIITILDKRLYSKNYGEKLLKNLPPFQQLLNDSVVKLKQIPAIAHLFMV
jgi:ATP-dependent DNA helicase DinG